MKKRILQTVEERRREIISLTRELVRTPSENKPPNGGELPCQKIIYEFFKEAGLEQIDHFRGWLPGRVCYATSQDGFHWEKPALGLVEYELQP